MFLQQIEAFLLTLRDEYGFVLPVDRLKSCLSCVQDITDIQEVLFRLQSLTCSSPEQVEIFQSVFAQKFLKMRPGATSKKPETDRMTAEERAEMEMERQLANARNKTETAQRRIRTSQENSEELDRRIGEVDEELKGKREKLQETGQQDAPSAEQISQVRQTMLPDPENAGLKKARKAVEDALSAADQAGWKTKSARQVMQKALGSSEYAKELDSLVADLMKEARNARGSGKPQAFAALLKAVAAVKTLKTAAGKSVSMSSKKDYNAMNRAKRALEKQQKEIREEIENLEDRRQQLEREKKREDQIQKQWARNRAEAEEKMNRLQKQKEEREQQRARKEKESGQKSGEQGGLLIKPKAISHRELFTQGIRAVQTTAEEAKLMQTTLQGMSAQDRQKVLSFIRANARIFRQTLRRRQRSPHRRRVDIRATVRIAARTGGEPVVIRYQAPKRSHARVVILTDISGSCRQASSLALYFMAMMSEAFPGGCRKFVFVNSLVPVDPFFRERSPDDGVQEVMNNVPTRGIYSDYGTTIHTLREDYGGTFHRDTTLIILGDARNNRRKSYAEDLKWISDRCCRLFWLNVDPVSKWNQGDSIIGEYEKAGAEVYHVGTAGDLLNFLSEVTAGRPG